MLLRLQPARVTVGSSFTITCSVTAAIPLERLTLTLLHGEKPLHVQTFENGTDTPATATHNAIAHKKDGHHNFSCRADLDLHALGRGVISNVSEVQVLQVYGEEEPHPYPHPPPPRTDGGKERALAFSSLEEMKSLAHSLPAQGVGILGPHTQSRGLPLMLPLPWSFLQVTSFRVPSLDLDDLFGN